MMNNNRLDYRKNRRKITIGFAAFGVLVPFMILWLASPDTPEPVGTIFRYTCFVGKYMLLLFSPDCPMTSLSVFFAVQLMIYGTVGWLIAGIVIPRRK